MLIALERRRLLGDVVNEEEFLLGEKVSQGLKAMGITKERADAIAKAVGLSTCGCEAREKWLDEVGKKFGQAAKDLFQNLLKDK